MAKPRRCVAILLTCLLAAVSAAGGRIEDGVLMVDGKPFFPLGGWDFAYTSPEDIARLGMNTSFRGGPSRLEAVEKFRQHMRRCAELGIQVVPYLSYGGAGVTPWPPESVRAISKLADEPNLLAWYVGDDIGMEHLEGIQQTVNILREETPSIPTVADYIAEKTPEAKTTFTQYIDIRCQYTYPIPNEPYSKYLAFFDEQREFVGDPLWTWVQSFMWGWTGRALNVGGEGPGPIPDPEQVRLLAFAAINRGVRGLLFFAHHVLHRLPELAAEVALACREVRVFNDALAAGRPIFNLDTSDPEVNAAAFRYGDSVVISAALFRAYYNRWVDEGIVKDISITCPWEAPGVPKAVLVSSPDLIECRVDKAEEPDCIRITVPTLELCGFVLVTADEEELARVRAEIERIPELLNTLALIGGTSQMRKTADVVWQLGIDNLYESSATVMAARRANEQCAEAIEQGRFGDAVRAWRETLRRCRLLLDETMRFAETREPNLTEADRRFLISPYGLRNLKGLGTMPAADDPWRFVTRYKVVGPYPLEWDGVRSSVIPEGFNRIYPPERNPRKQKPYATLDGPAQWREAETDLSGLLDLLPYFSTTENVVAYARCTVISPKDQTVRLSLGSNDGVKILVNGQEVFSWCSVPQGGRSARPHQNELEAALAAGPNEVLAKVENLGANWQLYLAFHDPNRELEFRTE